MLNTARFLGLIDDQNARTTQAQQIFTLHEPEKFNEEFSNRIKASYSQLFKLYNEDAWVQSLDKLVSFFRQTDQTTERVGKEQARTFQTLARYVGRLGTSNPPKTKTKDSKPKAKTAPRVKPALTPVSGASFNESDHTSQPANTYNEKNLGLTVRIEINLPVAEDQDTYDRIFRSIRENLLNG